jgi:hypothetical protein
MRDITEISILQGGCFGACPMYTATILSSGNLLYAGEGFVPRIGHYHANFGRNSWAHLCQLVEDVNFFDQPDSIVRVDDLPNTMFHIVADGQVKQVDVQVLEWPHELWLLESALMGFLDLEHRRWEAEASGLRGHLKHLPTFPDKPRAEWQQWDIPYVSVDRQASPDPVLPVDTRTIFRVPIDETGAFSVPLRPGRYKVSYNSKQLCEQVLIRPNAWQEIKIRNK